LTSSKTKREDTREKFTLYRDALKVKEYFLFDPRADYLQPRVKGYRLRNGEYIPIEPVAGRLPSKKLQLHLEAAGQELRFYDTVTKRWLPNTKDLIEQFRQRADQAKQRAEQETQRAEQETQRAEQETQRAEQYRNEYKRLRLLRQERNGQ
jgi:hypothetical protein